MASRKQRKRREKEKRHEYELVVVDETGEEHPLDPDELRSKRKEKEKEADKGRKPGGKGQPARGGTRSRGPVREVKPPSLNRVWKRVAFFGAFMFLVLSFLGGKNESIKARLALVVVYTALFIPFIYLMDRVQYRQYLRRIGQEQPPKTGRASRAARTSTKPPGTADEQPGPRIFGMGLRRGRRR